MKVAILTLPNARRACAKCIEERGQPDPLDARDAFYPRLPGFAAAEHFFEQYFTRSQSRSHFFRQANARMQWGQVFEGK